MAFEGPLMLTGVMMIENISLPFSAYVPCSILLLPPPSVGPNVRFVTDDPIKPNRNATKLDGIYSHLHTISDQEFETFSPLAKFYHNRYTLGLQISYSCQYISHKHEYIFYFFIVQLWKLAEASRSSKAIVSGD